MSEGSTFRVITVLAASAWFSPASSAARRASSSRLSGGHFHLAQAATVGDFGQERVGDRGNVGQAVIAGDDAQELARQIADCAWPAIASTALDAGTARHQRAWLRRGADRHYRPAWRANAPYRGQRRPKPALRQARTTPRHIAALQACEWNSNQPQNTISFGTRHGKAWLRLYGVRLTYSSGVRNADHDVAHWF